MKPCASTGCPNLTHARHCDVHAKADMKEYNKYRRDPESNSRYGRDWKKIRSSFLSANPLCERCRDGGKFAPATMVHHRRALSDGGTNDYKNLMSLCNTCHETIHAKQKDRW